MIRVGVFGAAGRMGKTVCDAIAAASDCALVAAVDPFGAGERVAGSEVIVSADPHVFLDAGVEVSVDFTVLDAVRENIRWCAAHDISTVVGTTGLSTDDLDEYAELFTHSAAHDHEVLQKVLVTEPERLLPLLTTEQDRPLQYITAFLLPYLQREQEIGGVRVGVDLAESPDFVARMLLSLIGSHWDWSLDDRAEVATLVRTQFLAGILTDAARVEG